ncbi:hypothetical protein VTO73DRAFT_15477 [Trametes versicolor]
MGDISPADSELIGLWLELLMTGAYLAYFPQCVMILRRKMREGLSLLLPLSCGIIFVITVTVAALAMRRSYSAFTAHGQGLPNPEMFYANPATPMGLTKNAFETIMSIISDIIIVYRTFIVWDVNPLVIIFPSCLLLTNIGMGIWALVALGNVKGSDPTTLIPVGVRTRYFVILTFCLNMFCAGMICWRIWTKSHGLASGLATRGTTRRVFETVLQTAAIHCAVLLVIIVLDSLNLNLFFIFVDLLMPLQAFVFTVLIVRANVHNNRSTVTMSLAWQSSTFGGSSSRVARTQRPPGVEIDLERIVHTDSGSIPQRYPRVKSTFASDTESTPEHDKGDLQV